MNATTLTFTNTTENGTWNALKPVGERFTLNNTTVTDTSEVTAFLHTLPGEDTAGLLPAHLMLITHLVTYNEFDSITDARTAFTTLLTNPELCFTILNTSTITSSDLREHAATSTTVVSYLLRLALSHGFLHALNADELLDIVLAQVDSDELSLQQVANYFMFLLLLNPTDVTQWTQQERQWSQDALTITKTLNNNMVASNPTLLPWVLNISHENNYLGVPFNSAQQYGAALHRNTFIYVLIAATSYAMGIDDPTTDKGTIRLMACAHITHWYSRTLNPSTVNYIQQMWAAHEWLSVTEEDKTTRDKALLALAHTTWVTRKTPEQVAINVTATYNAIQLGWDLPHVLRLLTAIHMLGTHCSTDDIVHLLRTIK